MNSYGLLQAIRSQIHFSQLSAWWCSNRAQLPKNISYHVLPLKQTDANSCPLQHKFPVLAFNTTYLQVSILLIPYCKKKEKKKPSLFFGSFSIIRPLHKTFRVKKGCFFSGLGRTWTWTLGRQYYSVALSTRHLDRLVFHPFFPFFNHFLQYLPGLFIPCSRYFFPQCA